MNVCIYILIYIYIYTHNIYITSYRYPGMRCMKANSVLGNLAFRPASSWSSFARLAFTNSIYNMLYYNYYIVLYYIIL